MTTKHNSVLEKVAGIEAKDEADSVPIQQQFAFAYVKGEAVVEKPEDLGYIFDRIDAQINGLF